MSKDYYNTVIEGQEELKTSKVKAKKQKDQILAIYKHSRKPLSPSRVWQFYGFSDSNVPITSIRRAISNLEKEGHLRKTGITEMGLYGKPNYCWEYIETIHIKTDDDDQLRLI